MYRFWMFVVIVWNAATANDETEIETIISSIKSSEFKCRVVIDNRFI